MQLTSTTDTEASQRSAGGSLLARLNNPIAAAVIALLGWLAFVLARWQTWAAGHISLFIMAGHVYSGPAQMPHVPSKGYDGQFYYRLALNPFNWHQTAYGITMDHNYRYTRIGYPVVAWILSLGQHHLVPTVLVVVNLICVGIVGWLGGMFARESGRHALWGLLFVAYFGLVISVGRDTSEPLADACMLGGLLAYRHSRYVLAALLIAYGVITNEPILVAAVAIALTRLYEMYRRRARPGMADLVWVLPGAAYVVLQGIEHVVVKGKAGGVADATANLTLPFKAWSRPSIRDYPQDELDAPGHVRHQPDRVHRPGGDRGGRPAGAAVDDRAGARAGRVRGLRAGRDGARVRAVLGQHVRRRPDVHRRVPDGRDHAAGHPGHAVGGDARAPRSSGCSRPTGWSRTSTSPGSPRSRSPP